MMEQIQQNHGNQEDIHKFTLLSLTLQSSPNSASEC